MSEDPESPDLLDPQFYADLGAMHASLTALRQKDGLWRDEKNDLWAAVHHADVIEIERDDSTFSSRGYRSIASPEEADMIALDDPLHAEQRRLVARRFTPRAVRRLESHITALVDALIDDFIYRGEFDVVAELAAPLPARLTAHLLGFPQDVASEIKGWSERLMRYDSAQSDPDAMVGFIGAIMEFSQVLGPLIEQRRQSPEDDLISVWSKAQLEGCPMQDHVIMQETGLFISGGAETTRTVISRGLAELSAHPDYWEQLHDDPSLVPLAVEELIRWVSPLNNFFRTATKPARIGDVDIDAGDRLILLYPSANRDERVFADPFGFDIRRAQNPHLSFGFGTHFCLGASLARLELRIVLERLTTRLTNLEVVEDLDIEPNIFVSAVRSGRIGFTTR
jgi:cytochrome P450 family 142 subfamily A polypeptide 1